MWNSGRLQPAFSREKKPFATAPVAASFCLCSHLMTITFRFEAWPNLDTCKEGSEFSMKELLLFGKEAGDSVKAIELQCKMPGDPDYSLCLSGSNIKMKSISSALSTEGLIISAALIGTFVIGIMWKRLKSR